MFNFLALWAGWMTQDWYVGWISCMGLIWGGEPMCQPALDPCGSSQTLDPTLGTLTDIRCMRPHYPTCVAPLRSGNLAAGELWQCKLLKVPEPWQLPLIPLLWHCRWDFATTLPLPNFQKNGKPHRTHDMAWSPGFNLWVGDWLLPI